MSAICRELHRINRAMSCSHLVLRTVNSDLSNNKHDQSISRFIYFLLNIVAVVVALVITISIITRTVLHTTKCIIIIIMMQYVICCSSIN